MASNHSLKDSKKNRHATSNNLVTDPHYKEPVTGGYVKTWEITSLDWDLDLDDTNETLPKFDLAQEEFNDSFWQSVSDEILRMNEKAMLDICEPSSELLHPKPGVANLQPINSDMYFNGCKDQSKKINNFVCTYTKMVEQGKCHEADWPGTLISLYHYYCKTQKSETPFLLKYKKLRNKKLKAVSSETPLQSFVNTLNIITRLYKRAEWRRSRFDHGPKKKKRTTWREETRQLAEYKGGIPYLRGMQPKTSPLANLRIGRKGSKPEGEYIKAVKVAAFKKRHFDEWQVKVVEDKELQKSIQKIETASKNYGQDLCKVINEEKILVKGFDVNRARMELLQNVYKSNLQDKLERTPNMCCHQAGYNHISHRKRFDPTEILQKLCYKKVFENITRKPGRRIFEPSVFKCK